MNKKEVIIRDRGIFSYLVVTNLEQIPEVWEEVFNCK